MQAGKELARSRSPFKFDRENKQVKFEDKKEIAGGDSLMASQNDYKFEEDVGIVHPEGWQNEVEPKHEIVYRSNVNIGQYWYAAVHSSLFLKFLMIMKKQISSKLVDFVVLVVPDSQTVI